MPNKGTDTMAMNEKTIEKDNKKDLEDAAEAMENVIAEAGEDEEAEASEGAEQGDAAQEEASGDEAEAAVENAKEAFGGLDLRAAHCFGYRVPKERCWKYIADQSEDVGWDNIDKEQLEKSLAKDVDESYLKIAEFKLVNVDDGMAYSLWFDNNKALWGVEVLDSPKAEMSIEERADFFKSSMFTKIAKKTYYKLLNALKTYNNDVKPHSDSGELLLVDTVKLDAILHFLDLDYFLKNVLAGKYLSY